MAHSAVLPAGPKARPSSGSARRSLPAADPEKRKRLLHAAAKTFGRRGFHEAKIADIASEAGVAEGTVYLYFRNKEDLLGCVFDETMDEVLAEARAVRHAGGSAAEKLVRLVTSTSASSGRTGTSRPSSRSSSGGAPASSSASPGASSWSTSVSSTAS